MTIPVGAIVRPGLNYLDRTGRLRDWYGANSAQGWVEFNLGPIAATGGPVWNPATSTASVTPSYAVDDYYTVRVWDIDLGELVSAYYPGAELTVGLAAGVPVLDAGGAWRLFPSPLADVRSLSIVRMR